MFCLVFCRLYVYIHNIGSTNNQGSIILLRKGKDFSSGKRIQEKKEKKGKKGRKKGKKKQNYITVLTQESGQGNSNDINSPLFLNSDKLHSPVA